MEHKQTPIQIEVYRDDQPDYDYMPQPPTIAEKAIEAVGQGFNNVLGHIALQTKMAVYDSLHGTNYRAIRNELTRQARNKRFEQSIGLIAIKKK